MEWWWHDHNTAMVYWRSDSEHINALSHCLAVFKGHFIIFYVSVRSSEREPDHQHYTYCSSLVNYFSFGYSKDPIIWSYWSNCSVEMYFLGWSYIATLKVVIIAILSCDDRSISHLELIGHLAKSNQRMNCIWRKYSSIDPRNTMQIVWMGD